MIYHHNLNPVAFTSLGYFDVHWYGIMYVIGFLLAWQLGKQKIKSTRYMCEKTLIDTISSIAFGLLIGGRLGYCLIYKTSMFFNNPLILFKVREGGMAFHGALIGGLLALKWQTRKLGLTTVEIMDFFAPLIPPGLLFGRLGNFINGELWGRATNQSWGVIFPMADQQPRHPSQLYEMVGEGLILWSILYYLSRKKTHPGFLSQAFLISYGLIRFLIEFYREPDYDMGYLSHTNLTMGQLLCFVMIAFGLTWRLLQVIRRYHTDQLLDNNSEEICTQ